LGVLALRLDEELRDYRDWLEKHRRDPFLWLVIVLPLTFAAVTVGVPGILAYKFPFSDARPALPVLPSGDIRATAVTFCKLPQATYMFGYEMSVEVDHRRIASARVCRDIVNGRWILAPSNARDAVNAGVGIASL